MATEEPPDELDQIHWLSDEELVWLELEAAGVIVRGRE